MKGILQLADRFEQQFDKTAGRSNKKKLSRNRLSSKRDVAKTKYQSERNLLTGLEKERSKLEQKIQDCQDGMYSSRGNMLKLTDVLRTMDLADCNYVIMYENDSQDVSFIIDGDENHIKVNDDGELEVTLMKDHRKAKRKEQKGSEEGLEGEESEDEESDESEESEDDEIEVDEEEDSDEDEEDDDEEKEDASDADDFDYFESELPNFRFME